MNKYLFAALAYASACVIAHADDVYFGGLGNTNRQWTGYSVQLSDYGLTNWATYILVERGIIGEAPASFHQVSNNFWKVIFDDHIYITNNIVTVAESLPMYALVMHNLHILEVTPGVTIRLLDETNELSLVRMSPADLRHIKDGKIPQQSGPAYPPQGVGSADP